MDFIKVHQLARDALNTLLGDDERLQHALGALEIMDRHQALAPCVSSLLRLVRHDSKYTEEWRLDIARAETPRCLTEDRSAGPKEVFQSFLAVFAPLYIAENDEWMQLVGQVRTDMPLALQVSSYSGLIENCYFQLHFLLMAGKLECMWLPGLERLERPEECCQDVLRYLRNVRRYHEKCAHLNHNQVPGEVRGAVAAEFHYYDLCQWLGAFALWADGDYAAFVELFRVLMPKLELLRLLHLYDAAVYMYALAFAVVRPFQELTLSDLTSPAIAAFFSLEAPLPAHVYRAMCLLAAVDFPAARAQFGEARERLSARFAVFFTLRFWLFWSRTVDVKMFLLIMSVTLRVPRAELLAQMGAADANALVLALCALGGAEAGVCYDKTRDEFFRSAPHEPLALRLDRLAHSVHAQAAALYVAGVVVKSVYEW